MTPVAPRVQVFATLRGAHLERLRQGPPTTVFHRSRRFDFDARLAEGLDLRQRGLPGLVVALVTAPRGSAQRVEVNEPLMAHGLSSGVAAVLALVVRRRSGRGGSRLVAYAIENRDPTGTGPVGVGPARVLRRVRAVRDRWLGHVVARRLDRLAFGTAGAEQTYRQAVGRHLDGVQTRVVPALPAPCGCPAPDSAPAEPLVVFLGALAPRKGVTTLVDAWPGIRARLGTGRLVVRGAGPLAGRLAEAAAREDTIDTGPTIDRDGVHQLLRRADVVVLLSRRTAHWREQVGLPIVEGLAHGCAVVTTDETGLADWLADHGHHVVPATAGVAEVTEAVVRAVRARRPAQDVLADLPSVDGRSAADTWLNGP